MVVSVAKKVPHRLNIIKQCISYRRKITTFQKNVIYIDKGQL
jgi:hypothetical protein